MNRNVSLWGMLAIATCALLGTASGCELIAGVDRDLIGQTGGGGTGGTTQGGGGTTTTTTTEGGGGTGGTTTSETGCSDASECPQPTEECKVATCDTTTGTCGEAAAVDGTPAQDQTAGDCKENVCMDGTVVPVDKDDDVEDDGKDCTMDACSAGMATHDPISSGLCDDMGGQVCDAGGTGNCVECNDDNDCLLHPEGKTKCDMTHVCVTPTCADGTLNGNETDVDCGGPQCGKCADTLDCVADSDCQSNNCGANDKCVAGTCDDMILNNMQLGETDVDCGGMTCPACAFDKECAVNADCIGGECTNKKCAATCTDTAQNQDESDVDCGGVCDDCENGQSCDDAGDCQSGFCDNLKCAACTGDGQCAAAEYCDMGVCVPDLMTGLACTAGTQCLTGNCVDGICCNSMMCGTCETCADASSLGNCSPVASGQIDDTCNMAGKQCDGVGNCKSTLGTACAAGTECLSNFCVDGVCCGAACTGICKTCNLTGFEGMCSNVAAGDEDTFPANSCTDPSTCDGNGACKLANGQSCTMGSQCASGNCVDGRCCGTSSCPNCQSCAITNMEGTCQNIAPGLPDSNAMPACTGTSACDGNGNCDLVDGEACASGAECVSGNCVDGVCCNTTCTGLCMACNVPGSVGTCSPNLAGTENPAMGGECSGPSFCNGAGACGTGAQGVGCSGGGCTSGLTCVDGVCCNSGCTTKCEACVMSKTGMANGTCAPVSAGTDPDGECDEPTPVCVASDTCGTVP